MDEYKKFPAVDNFNVNVQKDNQNGLVTVSLEGSVDGFPNLNFPLDPSDTVAWPTGPNPEYMKGVPRASGTGAFDVARQYANYCVSNQVFYNRARLAYQGDIVSKLSGVELYSASQDHRQLPQNLTILQTGLRLNNNPVSETYGYNIEEGNLSYNITFDNRPENCASGVLSEQITITRGRPVDVHANLTVLGRESGPILQSIGTKTAFTQDLSIESVMPPMVFNKGDERMCVTGVVATGKGGHPQDDALLLSGAYHMIAEYDAFVDLTYRALTGMDNTVFKTADTENYDLKTGRYSRSVSWIYTRCSGLS